MQNGDLDLPVISLARGRPEHLANLVRGLCRQIVKPRELIVAVMQARPYDLPDAPFPVVQLSIEGQELPLAKARNLAAGAATGSRLVFLDADCIPSPDLVSDYARHLDTFDGLLMGEVMYLPGGATAGAWTYDSFAEVGERHSDRRGPPANGIEACADYRCFWSLNFAIRRETFAATGGFDERYVGYGGEDTDFSKGVTLSGIPLAWAKGALAYHQYHPHHMPPTHHLRSVIRNAELFERKWGYRTMGHWLHAFRLMELIDDEPGRPIRILREPNQDDLDLTGQQSHRPYANSASVIRWLESRRTTDALS